MTSLHKHISGPVAAAVRAGMLAACLVLGNAASAAEPEFTLITLTEDIADPWAIAALPDGDVLVTEKAGHLRLIRDGILQDDPVPGVPEVRVGGQGGLMDLVLAPDFADSGWLYMTIAKPGPDSLTGTTAVMRARFDGQRLTDLEEIIETRAWGEAASHYGTRLTFDDSGHLFLTIADRSAFYLTGRPMTEHPAQRLDTHMGKVLRLNLDGSVPADNPFVGRDDVLPEIWSFGHRDPQGIAFRPATGEMWEVEHGPLGGDELNLLLPGRNYGWPIVSKGDNYTDLTGFASVDSRDDMEEPRFYWLKTIAPSNILFYSGKQFPAWQGNALISGLFGEKLTRITLEGDRVTSVETIVEGVGRIRDVHEGPDGTIYLAINIGIAKAPIIRLQPVAQAE